MTGIVTGYNTALAAILLAAVAGSTATQLPSKTIHQPAIEQKQVGQLAEQPKNSWKEMLRLVSEF
jgi:hypothetical protein